MNDKVKYWLELSDFDYETAVAMLKSLNDSKCQDILSETKKIQEWIKMKL